MSLDIFTNVILDVIPSELMLRSFSSTKTVGVILFLCFTLIAVSKLIKPDLFKLLLVGNLKMSNINHYVNETHLINGRHTFLLTLNYFLSFSAVLFIIFSPDQNHEVKAWLIILGVTIISFILPIIGFYFTSILTGEDKSIRQLIKFRLLGMELIGLSYFILGLVASLSTIRLDALLIIALTISLGEFVFRIVKSWISVFHHKVSWYYIILYFCTLEILPLLVIVYLLNLNFNYINN